MIPRVMMFLFLLCLQLTSEFAKAQYFTGPTASSMGGAGVAAAEVSETVFLNPSTLAHAPVFEAGAFYREGYLLEDQGRGQMGLTLADNSKGILVPGALSYFRDRVSDSSGLSAEGELWQAAIGFFVARNFSFGASLYRLEQDVQGGDQFVQWNSSVGLTYALQKNFGVGLTYSNFLKQEQKIPVFLEQPPAWRFGFNYGFSEMIRFRADLQMQTANNPDQKGQILYGVEVKSFKFLSLRLGHRVDDVLKSSHITAGLGFDGPRLKMNYSFEKNTRGDFGAMHSVDIRIPVW